jgi:membrane dipeptidase
VTTRQSKPKPYTGYRSFQYLEPGVDYQPFRLAREVSRVEPYVVPVSSEQERTVQEILDEELVISLHDHPGAVGGERGHERGHTHQDAW